jgi:hypothetical protein
VALAIGAAASKQAATQPTARRWLRWVAGLDWLARAGMDPGWFMKDLWIEG